MRVVLIPTGRMEHAGLSESLGRVFPSVTFEVEPRNSEDVPPSFTSARMPPPSAKVEGKVDELVRRLAATAHPGRAGHPPDLVIAVEDTELENVDQPHLVTSAVCGAMNRHLDEIERKRGSIQRKKLAEALRERASFHLMTPMPEAYFFAEQGALVRAGARHPARLAERDWEELLTDDPPYLGDFGPCLRKKNRPEPCPWMTPDRERHPKNYLRYLCRPAEHPTCTDYRETHGGLAALRELDWRLVFHHVEAAPFARALFEDIAAALGLPHPFPGRASEHTSALRPRERPILRNI